MDAIADRLRDAVNSHDLERLVACFAEGFVNETPLHPARSFVGREQVRRNWAQIFAFVPDLRAEITASAEDAAAIWLEWHMWGTRRDGTHHEMRGVTVFARDHDRFASVRFYLEPVVDDGVDVDRSVRMQVHA